MAIITYISVYKSSKIFLILVMPMDFFYTELIYNEVDDKLEQLLTIKELEFIKPETCNFTRKLLADEINYHDACCITLTLYFQIYIINMTDKMT